MATWIDTAEVNAEMTGAEMKPSRRPEFMKNEKNWLHLKMNIKKVDTLKNSNLRCLN